MLDVPKDPSAQPAVDAAGQIRSAAALYGAFARGDLDGLIEGLSEDVTWDATDALWARGTYTGHNGVRDYFARLQDVWADLRLEDYQLEHLAAGTVITRGRLRGSSRATGDTADAPFVHRVDVGPDGKITLLKIMVDPDRPDPTGA